MNNFQMKFIRESRNRCSRLVLALDCEEWGKAERVLQEASGSIAAVKIHPEHAGLWNFGHGEAVKKIKGLAGGIPIILDAKLADIEKSNDMKARFYFSRGYDAVIVHGFPGEDAVKAVVDVANRMDKGVFLLTCMTSPGNLFGNKEVNELAKMAKRLEVSGVIAPGNDYECLSKVRRMVGKEMLILSPGIGAQGGEVEKALKAGADFAIVGRSITDAKSPSRAASEMQELINKLRK